MNISAKAPNTVVPLENLSHNLNLMAEVRPQRENDYIDLLGTFPFRPTIFLGLGGTGCRAVAKIKGLFTRIFEGDLGQEGRREVIPPMYAFRAFDTSLTEKQPGLEENLEWIPLVMNDVHSFMKHQGKNDFYENWLAPHLDESALTTGVRGYRNLGRMCMTANIDTFARAIDTAKSQILGGDPRIKIAQPIVYAFCSLAGGTGSGMLLDACFY